MFTIGNMGFDKFLKNRLKQLEIRQQKLVDDGVTNKASASKWVRGLSKPDLSSVPGLAKVLRMSEAEVLAAINNPRFDLDKYRARNNTGSAVFHAGSDVYSRYTDSKQLPILNSTQAARPAESIEGGECVGYERVFEMSNLGENSFWFRVEDHSMSSGKRGSVEPGDLVLIDPDAMPKPGKMVLAIDPSSGVVALRRYKDRGAGNYILSPDNNDFAEMENAEIVGAVRRVFIDDDVYE